MAIGAAYRPDPHADSSADRASVPAPRPTGAGGLAWVLTSHPPHREHEGKKQTRKQWVGRGRGEEERTIKKGIREEGQERKKQQKTTKPQWATAAARRRHRSGEDKKGEKSRRGRRRGDGAMRGREPQRRAGAGVAHHPRCRAGARTSGGQHTGPAGRSSTDRRITDANVTATNEAVGESRCCL